MYPIAFAHHKEAKEEDTNIILNRGKTKTARNLKIIENDILGKTPFIAGEHPSFADIVAYEVLYLPHLVGVTHESYRKAGYPKIADYLEKVEKEVPKCEHANHALYAYAKHLLSQGNNFPSLF